MRPLEGIRVLELGSHVAAPVIARLCADWGADVIKVELPGGEAYRTAGSEWKLPAAEDNNPIFQPQNMNKRSLCLDLNTVDGREALLTLFERADVFVTTTRIQELERFGIA